MLSITPPIVSHKRYNMSLHAPLEINGEKDSSIFSFSISNYAHSATFGTACILSFIVNLKVLQLICSRLYKRTHSDFAENVLLAQLSLICIGITTLSALSTFQQYAWKHVGFYLFVFFEGKIRCKNK